MLNISLQPCIKICDQCIGVDKLGHLIGQGYEYYQISVKDKKGDDLAKKYGEWLEGKAGNKYTKEEVQYFKQQVSGKIVGEGGYGLKAMGGVMSNADLAANEAGLKMYKDVAAGKFKDICDYISDKMDEEKNHNVYTDAVGKVVKGNNRK